MVSPSIVIYNRKRRPEASRPRRTFKGPLATPSEPHQCKHCSGNRTYIPQTALGCRGAGSVDRGTSFALPHSPRSRRFNFCTQAADLVRVGLLRLCQAVAHTTFDSKGQWFCYISPQRPLCCPRCLLVAPGCSWDPSGCLLGDSWVPLGCPLVPPMTVPRAQPTPMRPVLTLEVNPVAIYFWQRGDPSAHPSVSARHSPHQ